jgi:hypothetical protein
MLPNVMKLGLMAVMIAHSKIRTTIGAHEAMRPRRARRTGWADCARVASLPKTITSSNKLKRN